MENLIVFLAIVSSLVSEGDFTSHSYTECSKSAKEYLYQEPRLVLLLETEFEARIPEMCVLGAAEARAWTGDIRLALSDRWNMLGAPSWGCWEMAVAILSTASWLSSEDLESQAGSADLACREGPAEIHLWAQTLMETRPVILEPVLSLHVEDSRPRIEVTEQGIREALADVVGGLIMSWTLQ